MVDWLLNLDIIDGALPVAVWLLTAVSVIVLVIRRSARSWRVRALIGVVGGALIGVLLFYVVNVTNLFNTRLPAAVAWWVAAAFAAIGLAVASLRDSGVGRKVVAIAVILLALASAVLGVNAAFGIYRTLGSLLGMSSLQAVDGLSGPTGSSPTGPVYANWNPPADLPAKGKVGLLTGANAIPSSAGFTPRDASIYLPPAAQVKDAPALPFVVMMMGMPGDPDPSFIAAALDDLAAKNRGLAPIVIVADQLGDPARDPVCADSAKYGGVATYFNQDVVEYAKTKLNIIDDPKYWTIAGYSNGGACAFTWGAQYPEIWGNMISISGDRFPGAEIQSETIADVYGGDAKAYDAAKPAAWLEKNKGKFNGHAAMFTAGENDATFLPIAEANFALAKDAGFDATLYVVPGADHFATAVQGGLAKAFEVIYPTIGLAPQ